MTSFHIKHASILKYLTTICAILIGSASYAMEIPIEDFSMAPYSQSISDYLPASDNDYTVSLLDADYQKKQLQQFYNHYYSTDANGLSPWSDQLIKSVLPLVKAKELEVLNDFNNQNKSPAKKHYAENFKEHDESWWNKIKQNMNVNALDAIVFRTENKAIAVNNTMARGLPELAPDFHHASIPGEGFPFDKLQESAIWAGTPLYVISTSKDKAWSLVLTPDAYFAWVNSRDIAYVSEGFIHQWQKKVKSGLIAITETEASIVDTQQQFKFSGYIGAVFPLAHRQDEYTTLFIPEKNVNNQAIISTAMVPSSAAKIMPVPASKKNLAKILSELLHRPYGWGGAFFYNDCSQEIKSIFTPLGIWLPRNVGSQVKLDSTQDLSKLNTNERIHALQTLGHPLMTIISNGGHIMLYIGQNQNFEPVTYQNVWGLKNIHQDKRYVIGQSVFLPLLKNFPENSDILSQANREFFKLTYLDELKANADLPQAFVKKFLK